MIRKIAVKDKNGVIRMDEIGGRGGATPELDRIAIDKKSERVVRRRTSVKVDGKTVGRDAVLTWAEVEALTPNTGIAPTAEEKEMYRDDDGGYTRERIVYDGYISNDQASSSEPGGALDIQAYAKDPKHTVTMYTWNWKPYTNSSHLEWLDAPYWMNNAPETFTQYPPALIDARIGRMRKGMDDMKVALTGDDKYTAQQRVYIDVTSPDGAVGYYVLVLHNAQDSDRGIYRRSLHIDELGQKHPADGVQVPTACGGTVEEELTGPGSFLYTIWAYPAGTDLTDLLPNAEVALTSAQARTMLEENGTLSITEVVDASAAQETLEAYAGDYPLVYKVKVPYCQFLMVKVLLTDPRSDIAITSNDRLLNSYELGGITKYIPLTGRGAVMNWCGRVRSQEESFKGWSDTGRYFELHIERYVPESMRAALLELGALTEPEEPEEPSETPVEPTE